jgi:hypothetical protein
MSILVYTLYQVQSKHDILSIACNENCNIGTKVISVIDFITVQYGKHYLKEALFLRTVCRWQSVKVTFPLSLSLV